MISGLKLLIKVQKRLSIMTGTSFSIRVGGEPDDFHRALPVFQTMGTNIVHQGKAGSGQHTKMANQIAVCESISYA